MQQRRLRLGDILDDYCPRERRITNHAVVAMIEDTVKQTRCTTCDADHEYKEARVPARRRRDSGAAVAGTLAPRTRVAEPAAGELEHRLDAPFDEDDRLDGDDEPPIDEGMDDVAGDEVPLRAAAVFTAADAADDADEVDVPRRDDEGPVHRRLIRATLPRPEGQAPEWKEPDFTVRQPGSGSGRSFDGNRGNANGNRAGGGRGRRQAFGQGFGNGPGPSRFAGPPRQGQGGRQGQPHGQGGNRHGHGQPRSGHGQGSGQGQGQGQGRPSGGGRRRGR